MKPITPGTKVLARKKDFLPQALRVACQIGVPLTQSDCRS